MWKRLGFAVLSVVLIIASLFCFRWGFAQLSDVRQLDRLPLSSLDAVTQGVYAIEGRVAEQNALITTPYAKDRVVYFHYKLEEEYTDSEGNRKTRTLDSGESATTFLLEDSLSERQINPGRAIGDIEWHARQTYRRKSGDRIYTEHSIRPGDMIQMMAWYDYQREAFELSRMPAELETIVTYQTLQTEGGNTLFVSGLLISAATGLLAVGLAAALVVFGVHRYWVFVVVMTLGLLAALWSIGLIHLQKDWQDAAALYQERSEGALASREPAAIEDLYAMYALIKRSASQWPDSLLFRMAENESFRPPALSTNEQQRIESRLQDTSGSQYSQQWVVYVLAAGGTLGTAVLIWLALKAIRFKRLVEFVPTSQTTGLAYGIAELFGMINVDDRKPFLTSQLNSAKCVAYRYCVEERRGSGKNAKWVTLDEGEAQTEFWLEDEMGQVAVNPAGANIVYPEKNVDRQGRKRYTEYWLPPFRNVYCLGFAGIADADADRLSIQKSEDFEYLITTQEEDEVVKGRGASGFMLTGLALGFSLMAGTVLLSGSGLLTPLDLIKVSLIVPLLLLLITAILHYNGLVFLKNRVDKTRADIDTLLQKRHDLWPRLLTTVQGYMAHEKKLMAAMVKLRNGQSSYSENPDQAEKQLAFENKVVDAFIARVEDYPDLKANSLVKTFRDQMTRSEDELALIRQGYNDSVELYNTQIEKLPDVVLAKLFRFQPASSFNADPSARS
ncbi:LemA family protein [Reinekea blandensis]|uniref:LemA family domain protein n=1 Tax=Reinekea blandensis MED297 TaxID=314283 RepID=A4BJ82_9GAMM|nr:LemA family protein [Reinekea blandensis]EAR07835.1 lemA family domain protein [Reinekea sp. MED297] [Reinekea blandensis MED297]